MNLPDILQELLQAPSARELDSRQLDTLLQQYPYYETINVAKALHAAAAGQAGDSPLYAHAALVTGNELWLEVLLDEAVATAQASVETAPVLAEQDVTAAPHTDSEPQLERLSATATAPEQALHLVDENAAMSVDAITNPETASTAITVVDNDESIPLPTVATIEANATIEPAELLMETVNTAVEANTATETAIVDLENPETGMTATEASAAPETAAVEMEKFVFDLDESETITAEANTANDTAIVGLENPETAITAAEAIAGPETAAIEMEKFVFNLDESETTTTEANTANETAIVGLENPETAMTAIEANTAPETAAVAMEKFVFDLDESETTTTEANTANETAIVGLENPETAMTAIEANTTPETAAVAMEKFVFDLDESETTTTTEANTANETAIVGLENPETAMTAIEANTAPETAAVEMEKFVFDLDESETITADSNTANDTANVDVEKLVLDPAEPEAAVATVEAPSAAPPEITTGLSADPLMAMEPYHTIDYFAAVGIKPQADAKPVSRLDRQLKSFTGWLKSMKKVPAGQADTPISDAENQKVQQMASNSVKTTEIITETMAEVLINQGRVDEAIEIFKKLSLQDTDKSAYFAARIAHLKLK